MSRVARPSDGVHGEPLSPHAWWCAAALVVGDVIAIWKPWRGDLLTEGPGRVPMGPILVAFRDDLATVLAEEPANAEHLRHALSRIEAEPEKWAGYATESDVIRLKAGLTQKLVTVSERR